MKAKLLVHCWGYKSLTLCQRICASNAIPRVSQRDLCDQNIHLSSTLLFQILFLQKDKNKTIRMSQDALQTDIKLFIRDVICCQGWKMVKPSVFETAVCGGTLTATRTGQNISSPGYPNAYNQNVRCRWTIDSGSNRRQVSLTLADLSLAQDPSCSSEYIEFRDSPMVSGLRWEADR